MIYVILNVIFQKVSHYYSAYGQGIFAGEEYIKNFNGEYKHYNCIYGIRNLVEWLGFNIKIIESE